MADLITEEQLEAEQTQSNEVVDLTQEETTDEELSLLLEADSNYVIQHSTQQENCMICLEGLSGETIYALPECDHKFHQNCIMHWFRDGNCKCPLCNNIGQSHQHSGGFEYQSWKHRQAVYKQLRSFSRSKKAPNKLKKAVALIKKREQTLKALKEEIKKYKNSIHNDIFNNILKNYRKLTHKRWRLERTLRDKKYDLSQTTNIIPLIIVKKKYI